MKVEERELTAEKEYCAIWGQAQAENRWLRAICLGLVVSIGGLAYHSHVGWNRPIERIYVKEDSTGRATVVPGSTFAFMPSEANLKYFLTQFVYLHFARRKATVATELPRSLFFLDNPLANRTRQEIQSTDVIRKVASQANDLEVKVDRVVLRETQTKPYAAEVDYTLQTVDSGIKQVMEKKYFTASIQYLINAEIPNDIIQYNPIGLNIVYYRSDEAFRRPE